MIETIFLMVISGFIGYFFNKLQKEKSRLIYFIQHISDFNITIEPTPANPTKRDIPLYTHTLIIRNNGNKIAEDIEVRHIFLPRHISILPKVKLKDYRIERKNGGGTIFIKDIVPNEQVTVAYLDEYPYTPQSIFATVVKSKDGFAKAQPVVLYPWLPKWAIRFSQLLLYLGLLFIIFIIYKLWPYFADIVGKLGDIILK